MPSPKLDPVVLTDEERRVLDRRGAFHRRSGHREAILTAFRVGT
jgi:hypothetical protein